MPLVRISAARQQFWWLHMTVTLSQGLNAELSSTVCRVAESNYRIRRLTFTCRAFDAR
jgi:hypothetical protein